MSGPGKFSRRELLRLLAVGAGVARAGRLSAADGSAPADMTSAHSPDIRRAAREYPVVMRRVLIPAPGATLAALLVRPAAPGRFPATILPARAAGASHCEQSLHRQAALGRVLLVSLTKRACASDRAALEQYLRAHPAVGGEPEFPAM